MCRKPIMVATLALVTSLSAVLFSGTSASADAHVSKADLETVRVALAKYGVPQSTQKALLDAFAKGERWASETGAEPVATEVDEVGGSTRTIYRYEDGSVNVSTVEIPVEVGPGISPLGISGCQSYPVTGAKA